MVWFAIIIRMGDCRCLSWQESRRAGETYPLQRVADRISPCIMVLDKIQLNAELNRVWLKGHSNKRDMIWGQGCQAFYPILITH